MQATREQLKDEHLTAQDELTAVKRSYFQAKATYEELREAALRVLRVRNEIEKRQRGQYMSERKKNLMMLSLMR